MRKRTKSKMFRYDDFAEQKKIKWTHYMIVVPTYRDKDELQSAFEHMHDSDVDKEFVVVNQLSHEYLTAEEETHNIIVDKKLYKKLEAIREKNSQK